MRLKIERGILLAGLQRIQGIIEKRNTMPILSNLLMEAEGARLRIFATDLEVGLKGDYPASVSEPGAVSLSARKLCEVIRELPDTSIEITSQENHWVEISAAASRFRMVGLAPEEFPPAPNIEKETLISVGRKPLLEAIEKVSFAVGDNDARYILNGVFMNLKPKAKEKCYTMRLVGTDGHRLAMIEREIEFSTPKTSATTEYNLVISKKAILEIKRLLEEDEAEPALGLSENQLAFKKGSLLLVTRLMEGSYPNYQQVIPKENPKRAVVRREALERALKRVSIFASEKTSAIRLKLETDRMTLLSNNPDLGEAQEEIPADYKGEELVAGFNARYLLDTLSVMESETVLMHFNDPFSPCLVTDDADRQYLSVVMPMRI